uniref:Uncharacterized protein n=1 Tax=Oryza punctata TaxID=4537 RepID=A0A0E0MHS9_ORYPU
MEQPTNPTRESRPINSTTPRSSPSPTATNRRIPSRRGGGGVEKEAMTTAPHGSRPAAGGGRGRFLPPWFGLRETGSRRKLRPPSAAPVTCCEY